MSIGNVHLIRGQHVYLDGELRPACLRIAGGKILEAAENLDPGPGETLLDAGPLWVLPGMIDSQVHFREPGAPQKEDLESGSRAAIAGGVTSYLEMPNTRPATTSRETLEQKLALGADHSWADFGFFVGATAENVGQLPELEQLPGCAGVKIFMGSSTGSLLVAEDDVLEKVLRNGKRRVAVHAEHEPRLRQLMAEFKDQADHPRWHPRLRDPECARLAVERLVRLARLTDRPVHVLHTNSWQEMELLRTYAGQDCITVETTPQHLLLTAPACYEELGSFAQMNPPLREKEHAEALWQALNDGVIDIIGSDHAPHTREEKAKAYPGCPSGLPGVETVLPVLLDCVARGVLSLADLLRLYCENPARLYGIRHKGRLAGGYDADLVLVDPVEKWTVDGAQLQSRVGWTPWQGKTLCGRVKQTILRGQPVFRDGVFIASPGGKQLEFDAA